MKEKERVKPSSLHTLSSNISMPVPVMILMLTIIPTATVNFRAM
jgi:hypothetical protein